MRELHSFLTLNFPILSMYTLQGFHNLDMYDKLLLFLLYFRSLSACSTFLKFSLKCTDWLLINLTSYQYGRYLPKKPTAIEVKYTKGFHDLSTQVREKWSAKIRGGGVLRWKKAWKTDPGGSDRLPALLVTCRSLHNLAILVASSKHVYHCPSTLL